MKLSYSGNQTPNATSIAHAASNDTIHSPMEDRIVADTAFDKKELEIRREAVGSDRRDESVMGPPSVPYSTGPLHPNNQRDVPTGQDAPAILQPSILPGAFQQLDVHGSVLSSKTNNENTVEEIPLATPQGASNVSNNIAHTKNQKYKDKKSVDDKDSDYRTGTGKGKKHSKGGRRSPSPDFERDSVRHRHRSPHSSLSSSSNEERSSNESYSDER